MLDDRLWIAADPLRTEHAVPGLASMDHASAAPILGNGVLMFVS
jgi:hypothetical protein